MNERSTVEVSSLKTAIDALYERVMVANEKIDMILDFSFGPAPVQETRGEMPIELNKFILCNEIANIRSKMEELNDKLSLITERFGC